MPKYYSKILPLVILLFLLSKSIGNTDKHMQSKINAPFTKVDDYWVDSTLQTLTIEERIAQLFMVAVYSNKSEAYNKKVSEEIRKYQIGGVIFMQGGPVRQALLTNKLQSLVKVPLMIGIDGEHGLAMRLDSTVAYPKAMSIGAVQNNELVFSLGEEIARQCNRLGIHINFAPVVDVNSNPKNPIINVRSYGEDMTNVAKKGLSYALGMQSNRVLAVGKHFPGHGDTDTDSHKTLPTINHSKHRIDSVELNPFKHLIRNGVGGIMVAHLSVPVLNNNNITPVSLSQEVIGSLLKKELEFDGLIFTDALNMKGVTRDFKPGKIEVKALLAGNDVLLFPEKIDVAIKAVNKAVKKGIISEELINERCRKVLKAKKWFGLDQYKEIEIPNLIKDLNTPKARKIKNDIISNSLSLIKNNERIVPLKNLQDKKVLSISVGAKNTQFQNMLKNYTRVDQISLQADYSQNQIDKLKDTLSYYNLIVLSKHNTNNSAWKHYGTETKDVELIKTLALNNSLILAYFGSPYGLRKIVNIEKISAILVGYNDLPETNSLMAQAIFGGIPMAGKLPVTINENYRVNNGVVQNSKIRLSYPSLDNSLLDDTAFYKIDSIVYDALMMKAMPGCQVLFAKDGKVVFSKNYGSSTYTNKKAIQSSSIYDIASVTKMAATTISIMKLYEEGRINITSKLSSYLNEFKTKDKKHVRIDDLMAHQAKFHAWIPFYKNTWDENKKPKKNLYSKSFSNEFSIQVSNNLFLRKDYIDSIYQTILDTPLYKSKKYRYSDLGFYWLANLIHEISGVPIDKYVDSIYYTRLGMNNTSYLPLAKFDREQIIPTEKDNYFRYETVQGYVHDPGAAMLGGVSGHAGVFSTANDLAKLGQLMINEGSYGGDIYFSPKTLHVFNKNRFKRKGNRRGLGLDKPAMHPNEPGPTCESASQLSFGHSGFTGAYMWVDPENNSVFVFLSNRTYPDQNNFKLVKHDIRTKIHQAFYDVFKQ